MVNTGILMLALCSGLMAQQPSELERRVQELEEQVRQMKEAAAPPVPLPTPPAEPEREALAPLVVVSVEQSIAGPNREIRLPVSGYMDFHLNKDRGDPFQADFHRFVLLFGHSFSDRIKFWSELEVEHALVEGQEESGEVALEQAYLDFLIKPYFNIRAGMVLAPVGIVNERHEPPAYNGVERPFVETTLIPTTWRELGFGFTGDLGRGFRYRAYLASSLDASRFDAENGIAEGRANGFDASFRNPAKVGRLEYLGVRRLALGASFYSGHAGFRTPGINPLVTIADFDGRYRWKRFDLRGIFVVTWIGQARELNRRGQLVSGVNPNVASEMRGYYLEPAAHVLPRTFAHDLVLFARYEKYNTQQRMPAGYTPLPQFDRHSWVMGVTYKPHPDIAVKFDYAVNRNASHVVQAVDGINLGIGWWF
jgi:hypothetical protein